MLAAGEITFWHAIAIADATFSLTPEQARLVADRVLPRAAKQTVAQLRRCLNRAVVAVDPKSAAERAKQAHADRMLDWRPLPDGMAELRLITSATEVMAVYQAADAVAQKAKTAAGGGGGEFLPIAARRADALVALVIGDAVAGRPVAVNVTIDLPALLGLQHNPAELAGYGPIAAPLARALAADGRWRRMILDPQTGALLDLGHSRYRPSQALSRYVKTRDRTCVFPPAIGPPNPAKSTTASPTGQATRPADAPTETTSESCAPAITRSNTKAAGRCARQSERRRQHLDQPHRPPLPGRTPRPPTHHRRTRPDLRNACS